MNNFSNIKKPINATAVLILNNKKIFWGKGTGIEGEAIGEVCFNTSMTGYQEVITDPSYAGQIINFTSPHIGNVGTNEEDIETTYPAANGVIFREDITSPQSWRATSHLNDWLLKNKIIGISNIDTRSLTALIRDEGAPNGIICHNQEGFFDLDTLYQKAFEWSGLEGADLASDVSTKETYQWDETIWDPEVGYSTQTSPRYHIVALDFGIKYNILRCLSSLGAKITVVPANSSADTILSLKPDGIFLSNGPGDPKATGTYAIPTIKTLLKSNKPIFGICLGHQILCLALGAKTRKMHLGHRGGNHPVKNLVNGRVEITSQNHGFEVISDSLPETVDVTHISLFDNSNEGIKLKDKPVFSVQYHPESSPGPHDSRYLFEEFIENINKTL